ncbi:MAG: HEAT repeat domain-containing protein [Anaerolineales bacterium]|nr:HEAT repeat domain-containing protein [Anaerolineales bacterium]MBX3037624.1 HEAT repeat domain-containing protein [Anaerolineales bacterium]
MSDISRLVKMLQNEDHNKRYEACEELRVSQISLPQEAIDALIIAANDNDRDVADAAERALALHTSNTYNNSNKKDASTSSASKINTSIASFIIIMIIMFWCMASIPSDSSPESYEIRGNLMMAAMVFAPFILVPLIIVIFIIISGKKISNSKSQENSDEPSTK